MGWNKQINSDGDTLVDLAVDSLQRIATALEEIIELLKPRFIIHSLDPEELKEAIIPDKSLRRSLMEHPHTLPKR